MQQGFTLIELMVSLTLFIIVIMAAISSLYTVNNAARKVEAMRSVLDNLSFAMESMSRTIRTGTNIGCYATPGVDCAYPSSGGDYRVTVDATLGEAEGVTRTIQYVLSNGTIQKWSNGTQVALTAPAINVTDLKFYVEGATAGDGLQPKVIIFVQGTATAGNDIAPFAIQTQVSVRTAE